MQCADANECKEKKRNLLEMRACGWPCMRMALRADGPLQVIFLCGTAQIKDTQYSKGMGCADWRQGSPNELEGR